MVYRQCNVLAFQSKNSYYFTLLDLFLYIQGTVSYHSKIQRVCVYVYI